MNYTGRPSISGCRPVLSLYPTHYFCQYLLGIFITFTNSSLFCRAFSTNSRRLLRHASLDKAPKGSPFGGGAQPLRHCFAMPPPLPRGGFGSPRKVNGFARGSPTRGAVERSETERLYEGEPDLCSKAHPFAPRRAFSVQRKVTRPANGSPSGGAGEELATRLRGRGRWRRIPDTAIVSL